MKELNSEEYDVVLVTTVSDFYMDAYEGEQIMKKLKKDPRANINVEGNLINGEAILGAVMVETYQAYHNELAASHEVD